MPNHTPPDIVERLRHAITTAINDDISGRASRERVRLNARVEAMEDAAAEIERLRASAAKMRTALEPFVMLADRYDRSPEPVGDSFWVYVELGDCRRARLQTGGAP